MKDAELWRRRTYVGQTLVACMLSRLGLCRVARPAALISDCSDRLG